MLESVEDDHPRAPMLLPIKGVEPEIDIEAVLEQVENKSTCELYCGVRDLRKDRCCDAALPSKTDKQGNFTTLGNQMKYARKRFRANKMGDAELQLLSALPGIFDGAFGKVVQASQGETCVWRWTFQQAGRISTL